MSKKDEEARLEAARCAMFPQPPSATAEGARAFLEELGCDRKAFHARIREGAAALRAKALRSGSAPPPYLKRAIDAFAQPGELPADPRAAAAAADKWIISFEQTRPAPTSATLLRAARTTSRETNEADDRVMEGLADELRSELGDDDDSDRQPNT